MGLSEPMLATVEDGEEISRLHVRATAASDLTKIVHGSADPNQLAAYVSISTQLSIPRPYNRYVVIRDLDTNRIVSYVNWVIPHSMAEDEADALDFKAVVDAARANGTLPDRPGGLNVACNQEFAGKISQMRRSVLGDPARLCYLCANLATDPDFRRMGAATKLMSWPFEAADEADVVCYLDTDPEGPAINTYKRLGFAEAGQPLEMDLTRYGMNKMHHHVGMIRQPVPKTR